MTTAPDRVFIHHSDQIKADGTQCLVFTSSAPVNFKGTETEYVRALPEDWTRSLPMDVITPPDLLSALETLVATAKSHGLCNSLIRNCMRSTEPK